MNHQHRIALKIDHRRGLVATMLGTDIYILQHINYKISQQHVNYENFFTHSSTLQLYQVDLKWSVLFRPWYLGLRLGTTATPSSD